MPCSGHEHTRVDGVGILIGDLDAELLLNSHDDLNGVKAVKAEVVGEVSGGLNLWWVSVSAGGYIQVSGTVETYVGGVVDLRIDC